MQLFWLDPLNRLLFLNIIDHSINLWFVSQNMLLSGSVDKSLKCWQFARLGGLKWYAIPYYFFSKQFCTNLNLKAAHEYEFAKPI